VIDLDNFLLMVALEISKKTTKERLTSRLLPSILSVK